jgi:phage host-nuclease inhibitor protein Gam
VPTIDDIERKTKQFADARAELAERLQALKDEQEAAKRRRIQGLKNAVARLRAERDELLQLLQDNPDLFEQPKTRTLHGIRVGWMKQRGKIEIADTEAVVAGLRKLLGDEAVGFIKVTESPIKAALANLAAKDLKRIGVAVSDDIDMPFIKPADGEIDKLVDALLADDLEEVES